MVTTTEPSEITTVSAICGGMAASGDGGYVSVSVRGLCWGENPNPTINDHYMELGSGGVGQFSGTITGLENNTTYYVRAFAVTDEGTFFGEQQSFTTLDMLNIPAPTGAINGLFSVSPSKQVYFSQGNLQYQASTNTWRFAEHQYDYVGGIVNTSVEYGNVYYDGIKCNFVTLNRSLEG